MNRRGFIKCTALAGAAALLPINGQLFAADIKKTADTSGMKFGLCTYLWGAKWDLPTLLTKCEAADLHGLELRVEHKHGVEPELSTEKRRDVKKRFADSSVKLVGFGTNEDFHYAEPEKVRKNLERAKEYVRLSADCGGIGIKVKPNNLPKNVKQEKTVAQIAQALNELGQYANDFGQVIRLEVHGQCARIPIIRSIIEQVTEKNVGLCWNCNDVDLKDDGFEKNIKSVLKYFADTVHIHENLDKYPYKELLAILAENKYNGWLLFENHQHLDDPSEALIKLHKTFKTMLANI